MHRRTLLISIAVIIIGIGWYAFRPERLFIDMTVNEDFPGVAVGQTSASATASAVLLAGQFHGVAHKGTGMATVYQLSNGKRVLRFSEFETSNGPDVHVYLVAAEDVNDNATVERVGFVSLGPIKGNIGDQNYELPAEVDLDKYRSVTVWCRRFGVNFATAPLLPQRS